MNDNQLDLQSVLAGKIRAACPELAVATVRVISTGQFNHVAIVDAALVFRFPRYARQASELPTQVALLRGIGPYLDVPVPDPVYASSDTLPPGDAFIGYPMLPGVPLADGLVRALSDRALVALAGQLAGFLGALHDIPRSAVAAPLTNLDGRDRWADCYARVRQRLWPYMRTDARTIVARHFEAFLDDPRSFEYEPVIRHGDFGWGNILVDPTSARLSGVIDFDFVGLGDPAADLAIMLSPGRFGEGFERTFRSVYPVDEAMLARCRFYRGTWALQEALHGIEEGDLGAFERGIAQYR